jgi:hypothetical protein
MACCTRLFGSVLLRSCGFLQYIFPNFLFFLHLADYGGGACGYLFWSCMHKRRCLLVARRLLEK